MDAPAVFPVKIFGRNVPEMGMVIAAVNLMAPDVAWGQINRKIPQGHGQLIPWMADFSWANLDQSVGRGSKNKKLSSHFYFSIGGIFIASVDPPSRESTDHGLIKTWKAEGDSCLTATEGGSTYGGLLAGKYSRWKWGIKYK